MNIIIRNNTIYPFTVFSENNRYDLSKKLTVAVSTCSDNAKLLFEIQKKDSVIIDIVDVSLGLFAGDSTSTCVHCDYEIEVNKLSGETVIITLEECRWAARTQVHFISACAAPQNGEIIYESYNPKNLEKTRKKHKRIHSFVTSLLPLGIILFACIFIFSPPAASILFFFFWALIFAFPSFKEIKRFKELSDPNLINEKLTAHAKYRREHGEDFFDWDSRTDKFFKKILDKMFKPEEDK